MVASLQLKKEALEAKLRDKTNELKRLCFEEADLTGVLPPETPLEPGENPPQVRRRVGTAFTYPESLINKIKPKEDGVLAELELEREIQQGIAEAALVVANDSSVSKSVRRRHQGFYQESQRKLSDLDLRLRTLKQSQPKYKKKPRPQLDGGEVEGGEGERENIPEPSRSIPAHVAPASERGISPLMRANSHSYSGLPRRESPLHHSQSARIPPSYHMMPPQSIAVAHDYRHSTVMISERMTSHSYHSSESGSWWTKQSREVWHGTAPHTPQPQQVSAEHHFINESSSYHLDSRFNSLDRNAFCAPSYETDPRMSATLPRNVYTPSTSVLLPGQTYPENSLMRTQSLGNMESSKHLVDRTSKEKEWYESCLDSAPPRPQTLKPKTIATRSTSSVTNFEPTKPPTPAQSPTEPPPALKPLQAVVNSVQFDTVVPYESPKNQTVVQAGKWQPYREVSKPFEMSDFYKYSTKYRKSQAAPQGSNDTSPQQKGIYKPLQPQECQPVTNSRFPDQYPACSQSDQYSTPEEINSDVAWYHEKHNETSASSATLV